MLFIDICTARKANDYLPRPRPLVIPAERAHRIEDLIHLPPLHSVHSLIQLMETRLNLCVICGNCGQPFVPMIRYWNGSRRVEYVCKGYHRQGKESFLMLRNKNTFEIVLVIRKFQRCFGGAGNRTRTCTSKTEEPKGDVTTVKSLTIYVAARSLY